MQSSAPSLLLPKYVMDKQPLPSISSRLHFRSDIGYPTLHSDTSHQCQFSSNSFIHSPTLIIYHGIAPHLNGKSTENTRFALCMQLRIRVANRPLAKSGKVSCSIRTPQLTALDGWFYAIRTDTSEKKMLRVSIYIDLIFNGMVCNLV